MTDAGGGKVMQPYYQTPDSHITLYHGDAFATLRQMPDESVHCTITSPPYWGLRSYGTEPLVWGGDPECGHMLPVGDREGETYEGKRRWQHDGVSRQDTPEAWVKAARKGAPDHWNQGGQVIPTEERQAGYGTGQAIESATCSRCGARRGSLGLEPTIELYVEHIVEVFREVRRVLRRDGTLWLNMGDSYAGSGSPGGDFRDGKGGDKYLRPYNRKGGGLKPKDLCLIPARVALALQADGWWLRSDIIWAKPNPMPESVMDRPTKSHEYIFLLAKSEKYFYDADAIREPHTDESAKRYLRNSSYTGDPDATPYAMKNGPRGHGMPEQKWERGGIEAPSWVKGHSGYVKADGTVMINAAGRNARSVWTFPTAPYPGAHFATFPPELVERCIKAGTSEKGCCPTCGKQWERLVETKKRLLRREPTHTPFHNATKVDSTGWTPPNPITLAWRPTCKCPPQEPTQPIVLDPFLGSGTTAAVAYHMGRRCIGIDLNTSYLDLAKERLKQGVLL